jgi:hypothetical protein
MKRRKAKKRRLKAKGLRKISTITPYSKHVSDMLRKINSSYKERTSLQLSANGNLVIASQITSGLPCNGTCNGGIYFIT